MLLRKHWTLNPKTYTRSCVERYPAKDTKQKMTMMLHRKVFSSVSAMFCSLLCLFYIQPCLGVEIWRLKNTSNENNPMDFTCHRQCIEQHHGPSTCKSHSLAKHVSGATTDTTSGDMHLRLCNCETTQISQDRLLWMLPFAFLSCPFCSSWPASLWRSDIQFTLWRRCETMPNHAFYNTIIWRTDMLKPFETKHIKKWCLTRVTWKALISRWPPRPTVCSPFVVSSQTLPPRSPDEW